jgi:predicted house-cleaning noncanonical NTP pyrophosphatase (MazG superfamily)
VTDGKLVRDLIPDLIRESGRLAEVRYLSGGELASALAAKLREEAQEAAETVDRRERLIEELADLTEVMSALMALQGIDQREVAEAAQHKAPRRGRFDTGAWLTTAD